MSLPIVDTFRVPDIRGTWKSLSFSQKISVVSLLFMALIIPISVLATFSPIKLFQHAAYELPITPPTTPPITLPNITPSPSKSYRVFVTSTTYNGNLGGLTGADAKCQERATMANLGGAWKAWLSTENTNAKDRITDAEYTTMDGLTVATNKSDLLDGSLSNKINRTEYGVIPTSTGTATEAYTGTLPNGTFRGQTSCTKWTVAGYGDLVAVGGYDFADGRWTSKEYYSTCDFSRRLYCFEQPGQPIITPTPTYKPTIAPTSTIRPTATPTVHFAVIIPSTTNVIASIVKNYSDSTGLSYGSGFSITSNASATWQLYNNQDATYATPGGQFTPLVAQGFGFYESSGGITIGQTARVRTYVNNNRSAGTYKGSYMLQQIYQGKTTIVSRIYYTIYVAEPLPTPTLAISPTNTPTLKPTPTFVPINQSPVIKSASLPQASRLRYYSANISGYDLDKKDSLAMKITNLPFGLSYRCSTFSAFNQKNISCSITGFPTTKGTFSIKAVLSDNRDGVISKTFPLVVR